MTQQLKAFSASAEDPLRLIPSTHVAAGNCNSSYETSAALFWSPRVLHGYDTYLTFRQNTPYTHTI